jgi:hypothetical protein
MQQSFMYNVSADVFVVFIVLEAVKSRGYAVAMDSF